MSNALRGRWPWSPCSPVAIRLALTPHRRETASTATKRALPLDFEAVEVVPKSHEPPAYAVVFLDKAQTTVRVHDDLDTRRVACLVKSEARPDGR